MLSIIIVSYNVKTFLRQCLKSIFNSEIDFPIEVIVIDNYSFDQSHAMVKKEFSNVRIIENSENLGFSKAVNIGVESSNGEYICLLNPDTVVENSTFRELYNYYINKEDIGVVGAKIINPDGTTQLASKRSFPSLWIGISKFFGLSNLFPKSKFFGAYNQTFIDENKISNVDAVSGSCMLFSKNIYNNLNGFDESFFLYFEDTDFCTRVKDDGLKIIYYPRAKVIHFKGESHKHAPFDTIKIFHDSMSLFFQKHKSKFKYWPITWLLIKVGIIGHLIQSYFRQNQTKIITFLIDNLLILFSFLISISLWYSYQYNQSIDKLLLIKHWPLILCFIFIWIITAFNFKLYSERLASYGRAFASSILTFFISSVLVYYISSIAYSRVVLFLASIISSLIIPGWRIFAILRFRNKSSSISQFTPLFTRNIAIIGTSDEASNIGKILINSPSINFNLIGYIKYGKNKVELIDGSEIIGRIHQIKDIIKKYKLNEIVIPESLYSGDLLFELFRRTKDLNIIFKYISTEDNLLIGKGISEHIGPIKLIDLEIPLFDKFNLISKRIFDIIFASIFIFLSLPLQFLLYIINRVNCKLIWNNKNSYLKIYYFKSNKKIIKNLLTLYPILFGEMSFVGCQQINIDNKRPNLKFKPGLTGLGHIKSPNSKRDLKLFDDYYVRNQSFLLDLEIILKSLFNI